jgi:hypothetical protein
MVDKEGTGDWVAGRMRRLVFDGLEAESAQVQVISERRVRRADPGLNLDAYDQWHEKAHEEFDRDQARLMRGRA